MKARSLVLVALLGAALSCRKDAAAPTQSPTAVAPPTAAPATPDDPFTFRVTAAGAVHPDDLERIPAVGAQPIVKLLEHGQHPHRELRYALRRGDHGTTSLHMDMAMQVTVAGQPQPRTVLPRIVMLFELAVDDAAEGDAHLSGTLTDARVEAREGAVAKVIEVMTPRLAKMVGLRTSYWIDGLGQVRDPQVQPPPDHPAELNETVEQVRQSLGSSSVPLPREPVGVGARWQVMKRQTSGGIELVQIGTYHLDELRGDELVLDVVVTQFATSESANPKGIPTRIVRFAGGGVGTCTSHLSDVSASTADLQVKSDIEMLVFTSGTEVPTAVSAELSMHMGPPAARGR